MAVNFRKGPASLLADLEHRGFKIKSVVSSGENPVRTVQVLLNSGITVNWDREGQCIWTEGPWPDSEKVEGYLRRTYEGTWKNTFWRIAGPLTIAALLAVFLAFVSSNIRRSTPPHPSNTDTVQLE